MHVLVGEATNLGAESAHQKVTLGEEVDVKDHALDGCRRVTLPLCVHLGVFLIHYELVVGIHLFGLREHSHLVRGQVDTFEVGSKKYANQLYKRF